MRTCTNKRETELRKELIIKRLQEGLKPKLIAERVGCSYHFVINVRKELEEKGE